MLGPFAAAVLKGLWPAERGLRVRLISALGLIIALKAAAVLSPLLYRDLVDDMETIGAASIWVVVAYALVIGLMQAGEAVRQWAFLPVSQNASRVVMVAAFARMHHLSLKRQQDWRTGGLARVVERGGGALGVLLDMVLFTAAPTVIEFIAVGIVLWTVLSPPFAFVMAITLMSYAAFTAAVTRWQIHRRRDMNVADIVSAGMVTDSLMNSETVRVFGAERREIEKYDAARRRYAQAAVVSQRARTLSTLGQTLILTSGLTLLMVMAGRGVAGGDVTIGAFVMVVAYLLQLYLPLNMLGAAYANSRQALTDIEALADVMKARPDITDSEGVRPLGGGRGEIRVEGVSFSYRSRRVLDDVTLLIRPGEAVGLVGGTGSGKSTLLKLLARLHDPDNGNIRIDGRDLRDVALVSLRQRVGLVSQDVALFNDSLRSNILFGRPDADEEALNEAICMAGLGDVVARAHLGLETPVGERGFQLSGGERQRVALARVLLTRPPILLFDEATSALDTIMERTVMSALAALGEGRTTLTVAHRLSTIRHSDRILVMEAGRIVESGSHDRLLSRHGTYARLWSAQQGAGATG
jgi:ATP-binding cassette, subfamily B, heavy metal transporter